MSKEQLFTVKKSDLKELLELELKMLITNDEEAEKKLKEKAVKSLKNLTKNMTRENFIDLKHYFESQGFVRSNYELKNYKTSVTALNLIQETELKLSLSSLQHIVKEGILG